MESSLQPCSCALEDALQEETGVILRLTLLLLPTPYSSKSCTSYLSVFENSFFHIFYPVSSFFKH